MKKGSKQALIRQTINAKIRQQIARLNRSKDGTKYGICNAFYALIFSLYIGSTEFSVAYYHYSFTMPIIAFFIFRNLWKWIFNPIKEHPKIELISFSLLGSFLTSYFSYVLFMIVTLLIEVFGESVPNIYEYILNLFLVLTVGIIWTVYSMKYLFFSPIYVPIIIGLFLFHKKNE